MTTIGAVVLALTFTVPARPPAATSDEIAPEQQPQAATPSGAPTDPFPYRPVCESLFLKSTWQLSGKQTFCDLVQNRIFSSTAFAGAAFAAATSPLWEKWFNATNEGGFPRRLGVDFAQNGFKSAGGYLGGLVFREDPRESPPFLIMKKVSKPRGFWNRTAHAVRESVTAYHCSNECTTAADVSERPALSRITGSLASGFSIELLSADRSDLTRRAWRGSAAAYGATFANSLLTEFKPELSAFGGRLLTALGIR